MMAALVQGRSPAPYTYLSELTFKLGAKLEFNQSCGLDNNLPSKANMTTTTSAPKSVYSCSGNSVQLHLQLEAPHLKTQLNSFRSFSANLFCI